MQTLLPSDKGHNESIMRKHIDGLSEEDKLRLVDAVNDFTSPIVQVAESVIAKYPLSVWRRALGGRFNIKIGFGEYVDTLVHLYAAEEPPEPEPPIIEKTSQPRRQQSTPRTFVRGKPSSGGGFYFSTPTQKAAQ